MLPRPRVAVPRVSPRLLPPRLPAVASRPPKERALRVPTVRERELPLPRLAVVRAERLRDVVGRPEMLRVEVVRPEPLREEVVRPEPLRIEVVRLPKRLLDLERLSPPEDATVLVRVPLPLRSRLAEPRVVPLRADDQFLRRPSAAWLRAARAVVERVVVLLLVEEGEVKRERLLEAPALDLVRLEYVVRGDVERVREEE